MIATSPAWAYMQPLASTHISHFWPYRSWRDSRGSSTFPSNLLERIALGHWDRGSAAYYAPNIARDGAAQSLRLSSPQ